MSTAALRSQSPSPLPSPRVPGEGANAPASEAPILSPLIGHCLLTLRLNCKSAQAVVYGYLVPIFFLFAFGSIFRSSSPSLLHEMGQLLTITVLGGCCFGMPTGLVAERERGVWRRYRLLPAATGSLVTSTMVARFVIVISAAVMQIVLARLCYGTPLPRHPIELLVAFTLVAVALMGLGLVIAALADNVPAVQALGQCVFLPMILIGGVGVPLAVLPVWAQRVAGFFPGRYAVEALQPCFSSSSGIWHSGFDLLALAVIGAAALVAGAKLFRWDSAEHVGGGAGGWVAVALLAWIAVGVAAACTGHLQPIAPAAGGADPAANITDAQINGITYEGLPADDDVITPLAATNDDLGGESRRRMDDLTGKLATWPPGNTGSLAQRVRNLVSVATIADVEQDPLEGHVARAVFDHLTNTFDADQLQRSLAWIVLAPQAGTVPGAAAELGLSGTVSEDVMRDRDQMYARKFLGHLLGKLPAQ